MACQFFQTASREQKLNKKHLIHQTIYDIVF